MRALAQRVTSARVEIGGRCHSEIGVGLLVFLGVECADGEEDAAYLAGKIANLRIFSDPQGLMNLSARDCDGDFLLVSQFTLHSSTKKGNRPSFIRAARPDQAIPLYEKFAEMLRNESGRKVQTGIFGADMQVTLTNDGPVTIWIDSKAKE